MRFKPSHGDKGSKGASVASEKSGRLPRQTIHRRPRGDEEISTSQRQGILRLFEAIRSLPSSGSGRARGRGGLESLNFSPKAGRYERREAIARGGMGAIYRVYDRDLERISAMKVALPEILDSRENALRFVAEGRITALLEHPNIVPVHDIGRSDENDLFFTMKLVAGELLGDILGELENGNPEYEARYSRHQLLMVFRKVCDAVAFAHSRGVIHRDIKPQNIMVGPYGEVLLMDWGLAKVVGEPDILQGAGRSGVRRPSHTQKHTTLGVVKGTPSYMAPEQAAGLTDEIDERTDIFLLGATLYHIVTLSAPFTGRNADEVILRALDGRPSPLAAESPGHDAPPELWRIIRKAMAPEPAERYSTVAELTRDLDAWMAGNVLSEHRVFEPGEYLMRAGEVGSEAYVILRGEVDVFEVIDGARLKLNRLGPGDVAGEMALITDELRSADVVAATRTEVQVISRATMQNALAKMPGWMGGVVRSLARRLRAANVRIHPLVCGNCVYPVLNQYRLLRQLVMAERRKRKRPERKGWGLSMDLVVRQIAVNLAVPPERVHKVLVLAEKEGLLQRTDEGRIAPVSDERFDNFLTVCEYLFQLPEWRGEADSTLPRRSPFAIPDFLELRDLHERLVTALCH